MKQQHGVRWFSRTLFVFLLTIGCELNPGVEDIVTSPKMKDDQASQYISLPAPDEYGNCPRGSTENVMEIELHFEGMPGYVSVEYEGYDIDSETEVLVLINGEETGYVPTTPNNEWGSRHTLLLRDEDVIDSSTNTLVFRNTTEREDGEPWGVRKVEARRFSDEGSPFGLDYVFALDPSASLPEYVQTFAEEVGVRWVNFTNIQWQKIEPFPPREGVHSYKWDTLDASVREWQKYGVNIMMSLRFRSQWANEEISTENFVYLSGLFQLFAVATGDYIPRPEHWEDLRDFVYNLVERYDGDGYQDMPGLLLPILHYQVGNEYYNELYWGGTVEEYGGFLEEAARAARNANQNVKIILSGIGYEDIYGYYDEVPEPLSQAYVDERLSKVSDAHLRFSKRREDFSLMSMQFQDSYDIVDARWPHYGCISKTKNYLRQFGLRDKEVWSAEIYTYMPLEGPLMVPNGHGFQAIPTPSKSAEYQKILKDVNHVDFPDINAWYRGMQSAQLVKNTVVALHAGAAKLMTGWAFDVQETNTPEPHAYCGLLSATFLRLWPAGYTYKLLIEKLDGIASIRRTDMPENVYVYECTVKDGKKVLVAFYDDHIAQNHDEPSGVQETEIPFWGSHAKVTHIITELDKTEPLVENIDVYGGLLRLDLTEYPVFIE